VSRKNMSQYGLFWSDGPLTEDQARHLTQNIQRKAGELWELVKHAYLRGAWSALGYQSWDEYCARELGTSRLRLPREVRTEVVASLRESGLSIRAIASATGHSVNTVQKSLTEVSQSDTPAEPDEDALADELIAAEPPGGLAEDSPGQTDRMQQALDRARKAAPVIGMDGKSYPAKPRRDIPASPTPETDDLVGWEVSVRKVERGLKELLGKAMALPSNAEYRDIARESVAELRQYLDAVDQIAQGDSLDDELRRLT
jgi:transposase-like protein